MKAEHTGKENARNVAARPDARVARRIEELLREQLGERGVDPAALAPHEIAAHMLCQMEDDGSMTSVWTGEPLLFVTPETIRRGEERSTLWRMFTRDDPSA